MIPAQVAGSAEQWRWVVGFEGMYEVSDHGRVRSVDRTFVDRLGRKRRYRGRIRKPSLVSGGYLAVCLSKGGAHKTTDIHCEVVKTFVGPRPPGMEIRHLDGDPTNNHLSNLRYGTALENQADRFRHGRLGRAVLTAEQVIEIRRRAAGGERQIDLAAEFGVTKLCIGKAVRRQSWRHVEYPAEVAS